MLSPLPVSSCCAPLLYFPPIAYFRALAQHTHWQLAYHQSYRKQTYANRCYIKTSQGRARLIVPVRHASHAIPLHAVTLVDWPRWGKQHWHALCTAYGKAPFFPYFAPEIEFIFFTAHESLAALNWVILQTCCKLLRWQPTMSCSLPQKTIPAEIADLCAYRNAKDDEPSNNTPAYPQVFGATFMPNLSILDLLFCQGLQANDYLHSQQA